VKGPRGQVGVILLGPALAVVAAVLGRALGGGLGLLAAAIALAVVGLATAVAIGRWRGAALGAAAGALWKLVGAINAHDGEGLALLASGGHVTGARIAEVGSWAGHARVTFVDGVRRGDLRGIAEHEVGVGGKGVQARRRVACAATPIVAASWTAPAPVQLWTLDDGLTSRPLAQETFHPITAPDPRGDCGRAIDAAIREHQLTRAADPIYLERLDTLADPEALRLQGLAVAIVAGAVWLLGFGWLRASRAWRARRRDHAGGSR
jgi:hypothetical protein